MKCGQRPRSAGVHPVECLRGNYQYDSILCPTSGMLDPFPFDQGITEYTELGHYEVDNGIHFIDIYI